MKHPVPDRVKPSFVIFDIRALWRLWAERQSARMSLNPVWHRMLHSCTRMATVGIKGLIIILRFVHMSYCRSWCNNCINFVCISTYTRMMAELCLMFPWTRAAVSTVYCPSDLCTHVMMWLYRHCFWTNKRLIDWLNCFIPAATFECSEWHCHQIWPWISTSLLRSARPVFIGSGNCDVSGDHWIQSQRRRRSMPSLLLASTTVMYTAGASKATNVLLVIRRSSIDVWGSLWMSTFIGSTCRCVKFKLVSMMHSCLHHKSPRYLMDCCIPISDVSSQRHLRSARRHYLVVPRHSLSSYGRRAFAVTGPTAWNSLRDPALSTDSFRRLLKTRLFSEYTQRIRGIAFYAL